MKAIQITRLGVRNCKPPTVTPVPAGVDAHVFMALYLEEQMSDGYKVVGSYGNPDTYGLSKRGGMIDSPVLKVELIEMEAVEVRQAS